MPAGGGNVSVDLRPLLPTAHQMPLHITSIDLKLHLTLTGDAANDEPGENFCRVLDRLELVDINSNTVVRLQGHHFDQLMKAVRGWRYPTPADGPQGDAEASHYWYANIPFHGGPNGVAGYAEFKDLIQPVDRFRETNLEVFFNAGALSFSTLNSATLYISFNCGPYKEVVQGADIRYGYMTHSDAQRFELPVNGKSVHTAILAVDDLDGSDVTVVNCEQFSFLNNVQLWQLVSSWNAMNADSPSEFIAHAAPEFVPLIWQDKRGSVQQTIGFPGQKAFFDVTNTIGEDVDLCWAQIHNTKRLADKLMGRAGTAFENKRYRKAGFAKKNGAGMARGSRAAAERMESMLPQKLVR